MRSPIRRVGRDSLIYGFSQMVVRGAGFILFPVYTNYVSPADMGRYALGTLLASLLVLAAQGGLGQAFLWQFGAAKDDEDRRNNFTRAFSAVTLSAFALLVLMILFRKTGGDFLFGSGYDVLMIYLGVSILCEAMAQYPLLILRCQGRAWLYEAMQLASMLAQVGVILFLVMGKNMGVRGIFLGQAAGFLLLLILTTPIIKKYGTLRVSWHGLGVMLRFGLPHLVSGLFIVMIDLSDRWILQIMADLDTVGIYNAGYKLGAFMGLAVAGFRYAWIPAIASLEPERIRPVLSRTATYFLLAGGWFYLFLFFFIEYGVRLKIGPIPFLGPRFTGGLPVVPWILGAYLCYGLYTLFIPGVYRAGRSGGLILIAGLGAALNIAGNVLLIPRMGMEGAALATLLAYVLMVILLLVYVQRLFPVRYEWGRLGIVLGLYLLAGLGGGLLHGPWTPLFRGIILTAIPLFLWAAGFFRAFAFR